MSTLKDYEFDFCMQLHAKLKERIRGKIHTTVRNDAMCVEIYMGPHGFAIAFDDFSGKLISGITSEAYANVIVREYKRYLIGKTCRQHFRTT